MAEKPMAKRPHESGKKGKLKADEPKAEEPKAEEPKATVVTQPHPRNDTDVEGGAVRDAVHAFLHDKASESEGVGGMDLRGKVQAHVEAVSEKADGRFMSPRTLVLGERTRAAASKFGAPRALGDISS